MAAHLALFTLMGAKADKKRKKLLEALQKAEKLRQERHEQVVARLREVRSLDKKERQIAEEELNLHSLRLSAVEESIKYFEYIIYTFLSGEIKERESQEWEHYMYCDGLPNVLQLPSLTMFFYSWQNTKYPTMESVFETIEDKYNLITKIDRLLEIPLNASDAKISNWREVRLNYKDEIFRKLDLGTYDIIKDIDARMRRIDYWKVDYQCSSSNIQMGMYAYLPFPLSVTVKRDPPYMEFQNVGVTIKLPLPFDRKVIISRVVHFTFDLISEHCKSWLQPLRPEEGTVVEIVDYWLNRKVQLARQRWLDEIQFLLSEKKRLTLTKPPPKKKKKKLPLAIDVLDAETITDEGQGDVSQEVVVEETEEVEEKWKRFNIVIKGMNIEQLMEYFKASIKEDVLDCFFNTETQEQNNIGMVIIRKLVEKSVNRDLRTSLLSLKVSDRFMNFLLEYFSEVPVAIDSEEEELIEEQQAEEHHAVMARPSIYEETRESVMLPSIREAMTLIVDPQEVNLRQSTILGGVYYFHFIKHIPQKFPLKEQCYIQYHVGEHQIETDDDFLFVYVPPPPFIPQSRKDVPPPDLNIGFLIQVTVVLPENFLWFETPSPVLWHYEDSVWSSQYVHDVNFNSKDKLMSFRIGRALPFAFSVNRFFNLPYQAWELRPGPTGSNTVQFTLIASPVVLEFSVKGGEVAIMSIKNIPDPFLKTYLKTYFRLNELIHLLKLRGLDIFPEDDTFLYVDGNSVKDYVVEEQVYMAIAVFAPYFQFSWSRWNRPAGWSKLVFLTRQLYSLKRLPDYIMILSDLFHATILNCAEDSEEFIEESITNIGFNADLFTLLRNICSPKVKKLVENCDIELTHTVYDLLRRIKVFSFS